MDQSGASVGYYETAAGSQACLFKGEVRQQHIKERQALLLKNSAFSALKQLWRRTHH